MAKKTTPTTHHRFPLARRIEHLIMMLSFGILGLTGLPQKFPLANISVWTVDVLGGIENLRIVHHLSATVMMLGTAWHILVAGYKVYVLREKMSMLPALQDVKDGIQAFLHNIGLRKKFPQMGRYTFEEKLEYWAFVWGAIVMGLTGFMMWNPITTAKILPGEWIPAAKAAHGGEAILAVLAIIIWHFYGVHIKLFNKAMWTGEMSEEEMLHEHPLELADIKAGVAAPQIKPEDIRKRQRIYFPIAAVLTIAMLAGVYGFVVPEQTALETVPPQPSPLAVYVPFTPTPTMVPTATPTPGPATATPESQPGEEALGPGWQEVAPLFAEKCNSCHATADMTGLALDTYANTMAGGKNGAVVTPGDSANSVLYTLQAAGSHPAVFGPEELAVIQAWIDAGAPETGSPPAPSSGPVWEGQVAEVFQSRCGTCHGGLASGGLNVSTYADLLAGGASGETILPGDSANSPLVLKLMGEHPGSFEEAELELVKAWIDGGALER
jgi:cytochrome b subunit of formate dehydrogenase/mono/diheme cytochrome c family protein